MALSVYVYPEIKVGHYTFKNCILSIDFKFEEKDKCAIYISRFKNPKKFGSIKSGNV